MPQALLEETALEGEGLSSGIIQVSLIRRKDPAGDDYMSVRQ